MSIEEFLSNLTWCGFLRWENVCSGLEGTSDWPFLIFALQKIFNQKESQKFSRPIPIHVLRSLHCQGEPRVAVHELAWRDERDSSPAKGTGIPSSRSPHTTSVNLCPVFMLTSKRLQIQSLCDLVTLLQNLVTYQIWLTLKWPWSWVLSLLEACPHG